MFTDLDGHTGQVESHGKQSSLAQHSLESTGELNFRDCESMAEMKGAVHVRIREGPHPFGLLSSNLGWCGSLSGH